MSQPVIVKLDGVAEELSSSKAVEAHREALSRFEQMLEVTSWSNRLDSRLQTVIEEMKELLLSMRDEAKSEEFATLDSQLQLILTKVFPEIVELCVVAADHVHLCDRYAEELRDDLVNLKQEIASIKENPSYRALELGERFLRKLSLLKPVHSNDPTSNEATEGGELSDRKLRLDYLVFNEWTENKLVDNRNTPFAAFDNWVTTFHHKGKVFGASRFVYSDLNERIFDLNQVYRVKDKSILEIGPFEGGNTKQLFDLGAKKITAIEANEEFYLKTLLVKEAFSLDALEPIIGDCNLLLDDKDRFPDKSYDLLYASGVLYHMSNPVESIRLFSRLSDTIYVNSHIASDEVPSGEWLDIDDKEGNSYRCRRNTYETKEHWGGVDRSAVWLDRESMFAAFQNLGFKINLLEESVNTIRGNYVAFLATR
jgi:phospholipid N-methyltransferase